MRKSALKTGFCLCLSSFLCFMLCACGDNKKSATRTDPLVVKAQAKEKAKARAAYRLANPQIAKLENNFKLVADKVLKPKGIIASLEITRLERTAKTPLADALTQENVQSADVKIKIEFAPDSHLLVAEEFKKSHAKGLQIRMAFAQKDFSYLEFTVAMDLPALLKKIEGREVSMQEFALYMRDSDQLKTAKKNYQFDEKTQTLHVKNFLKREGCDSNFSCTSQEYGAEATFKAQGDIEGLSNLMLDLLVTIQDLEELSDELQNFADMINLFNPGKLQIPFFNVR